MYARDYEHETGNHGKGKKTKFKAIPSEFTHTLLVQHLDVLGIRNFQQPLYYCMNNFLVIFTKSL